ncbi:hypothetical protein FV222_00145 [Methylobacterium sp. WL103]|uniref:hypothetical protein n=1 Tax=Methylobacterium sp. WL103 TaxID=2603891 RepID=UPI0011C8736E|nr:hypothetical protein [Methylobacterium sp. WL103]TXN08916.1 hypothetical protein FV222_00145 [Methylobacterium sp. WL103]
MSAWSSRLDQIDHASVRQHPSFFEVRSDGPASRLLGWISGIKGEAVKADHMVLYAAPADEDLEYVDETDGSKTIKISAIGEEVAYRVGLRQWYSPEDRAMTAHVAPQHAPAYAERERIVAAARYCYTWRHLVVSAEEAQALFDFGEFFPYEPANDTDTMLALRDEVAFFDVLAQAESLIIDARALLAGSISTNKLAAPSMSHYRPVRSA